MKDGLGKWEGGDWSDRVDPRLIAQALRGDPRSEKISPSNVGLNLSLDMARRAATSAYLDWQDRYTKVNAGLRPRMDNYIDVMSFVHDAYHRKRLTIKPSPTAAEAVAFDLCWARHGLPTFVLTHSLAAALSMTDCLSVRGMDVMMPFPSFAIVLPDGDQCPLQFLGHDGELAPARLVQVHLWKVFEDSESSGAYVRARDELLKQAEDQSFTRGELLSRAATIRDESSMAQQLSLRCYMNDGYSASTRTPAFDDLAMSQCKIAEYARRVKNDGTPLEEETAITARADQRCMRNMMMLVVNLCLYLNTNADEWRPRKQTKKEKRRREKAARRGQAVTPVAIKTWTIGRSVVASPALKRAAHAFGRRAQSARAWKVMSRHWVRGHWRNQAYGPKHTLRRLKRIEPFERGADKTDLRATDYEVQE